MTISPYPCISKSPEKIAFLGHTGVGKTSLINTLFDLDWFVDPALSSTKKLQSFTGKISRTIVELDNLWTVFDTPGIGENYIADDHYFPILCEAFHSSTILAWVVQANTRAYADDQTAILKISETKLESTLYGKKHCIVVNQVDKLYPENWDVVNNKPSLEQQEVIDGKLDLVFGRFKDYLPLTSRDCVIPLSVEKLYGFNELIRFIS